MAKEVLNKKTENTKSQIRAGAKAEKRKIVGAVKGAVKRGGNRNGGNKSENSKMHTDRLEMLVTVVNRHKAEFFEDLIQSFDVNMQLSVRARGTAQQQMLSLLGLEESPKTVIFSFIREDKVQDALAELEKKFQTIKDGKGIAYTVPLTSVIGVAIFGFLSNNAKTVKEDKNEKV